MPAEQPTVLLLPGLLCDASVWPAQQAALQALAPVHVSDYGDCNSIPAMAKRVLHDAPAGPLAVVGHSMGGRVALEIWRQAPHRVVGLALLDTGFQALPEGQAGVAERAGRMELLALARAGGMRAMGQRWARGMVHPDQLDTPLFQAVLQMIERSTPELFAAQLQALLGRPDATDLLPTITVPVLLLCGRQDNWSPLARHEQMQAALLASPASVELVVVENCGHMSTMEQAPTVSAALLRWLAGCLAPVAGVL
jgi:pimeloyl-ACP methyl ester carboxylesterase